MITLLRRHVDEMMAHASEANPEECCGLIGGMDRTAQTVYRLRNQSADPLVAYEAAPQELFAAQKQMRERGEQLLAIYHSHPRSIDPTPSETDVRLAFYPSAIYFIIGMSTDKRPLGAFRISERERRWERAGYRIAEPPGD
jgi:[CysO sulfur-carrier protein]-S-L-cysteine hydrolase